MLIYHLTLFENNDKVTSSHIYNGCENMHYARLRREFLIYPRYDTIAKVSFFLFCKSLFFIDVSLKERLPFLSCLSYLSDCVNTYIPHYVVSPARALTKDVPLLCSQSGTCAYKGRTPIVQSVRHVRLQRTYPYCAVIPARALTKDVPLLCSHSGTCAYKGRTPIVQSVRHVRLQSTCPYCAVSPARALTKYVPLLCSQSGTCAYKACTPIGHSLRCIYTMKSEHWACPLILSVTFKVGTKPIYQSVGYVYLPYLPV